MLGKGDISKKKKGRGPATEAVCIAERRDGGIANREAVESTAGWRVRGRGRGNREFKGTPGKRGEVRDTDRRGIRKL